MMIDISALKGCENLEDSYGEICTGCNMCGRFGKDTMWKARYDHYIRQLRELCDKLESVFPTREEAEQKLKEMLNDGK